MQLLNFHDWLFCFATRARCALVCCAMQERGSVTAAVALVSVLGSAAVFATTTVESGDISFEALAGAVDRGVNRVSANLEVRSSVIARSSDSLTTERVEFTLGVFGQGAVPLGTENAGEQLMISYRDGANYLPAVPYTFSFLGGNGDDILDAGELASISVDLAQVSGVALRGGERFTLELTAPVGGTVEVSRKMPPILQPVMSLH